MQLFLVSKQSRIKAEKPQRMTVGLLSQLSRFYSFASFLCDSFHVISVSLRRHFLISVAFRLIHFARVFWLPLAGLMFCRLRQCGQRSFNFSVWEIFCLVKFDKNCSLTISAATIIVQEKCKRFSKKMHFQLNSFFRPFFSSCASLRRRRCLWRHFRVYLISSLFSFPFHVRPEKNSWTSRRAFLHMTK